METIIFQGSGGGPIFSRRGGGSNIFQGEGSNCLFPIETHITCDFPGGGGGGGPDPVSPLDPHLDPDQLDPDRDRSGYRLFCKGYLLTTLVAKS